MLIDSNLMHFCAARTREIDADYRKHCVWGKHPEFPRSADDLYWLLSEKCDKPILIKDLHRTAKDSNLRGFYLRHADKNVIYLLREIGKPVLRYIMTKELFHVYLDQEGLRTTDVVELVQNMILRASPQSADLHLGHATNSETIAEIAAVEFLFPFAERVKHNNVKGSDGYAAIAEQYDLPQYLVERHLNDDMMSFLAPYFG